MRIFLDTNVIVSALLWGGVPRELLQATREKRVRLYTSTTLLLELTEILSRVKFSHKVAAAQLSLEQLVERYALLATVVHPLIITPTILDDPDDDHVLACALAAKAELIVSGDRHLLELKEFQGIQIVSTVKAVSLVNPA